MFAIEATRLHVVVLRLNLDLTAALPAGPAAPRRFGHEFMYSTLTRTLAHGHGTHCNCGTCQYTKAVLYTSKKTYKFARVRLRRTYTSDGENSKKKLHKQKKRRANIESKKLAKRKKLEIERQKKEALKKEKIKKAELKKIARKKEIEEKQKARLAKLNESKKNQIFFQ